MDRFYPYIVSGKKGHQLEQKFFARNGFACGKGGATN